AIDAGIGMVHQHFMLVPVFTVAENITLGVEHTRGLGLLDRRSAEAEVRRLSEEFGLPVDPHAVVEDLPVGVQQRVEILKALHREARLLILDEPTAVLTPQETEDLFRAMRSLKESGRSIVFISHKLKEHKAIVDRISVLRRGRIVGTADPATTSEQELANLMVGRPVELTVDKADRDAGEPVLSVRGITVLGARGKPAVDGVDLDVHRGEIVAIAGVEGNGQTELVRAITGLDPVTAGTIELLGRDVTGLSRKELLRAGVGHIPEDRNREGLVGDFTVAENLVLPMWDAAPFAERGRRRFGAIAELAEREVDDFDIRTPSIHTTAGSLSGGNAQKVVVAREFGRPLDLLVAAQPTRGVDVGSIEYIHRRIVDKRNEGAAVVIVSSELDEVLALADRVAVMFHGRLVGPFPMPVSKEAVGLMMAGESPDEAMGAAR
ncbi:MAG: ABC transporter ATP-binding protein, partial [Actinobacteria bacterium]|nr:ABC transporter ATP-binding protein [Actinomycetota bacterium]